MPRKEKRPPHVSKDVSRHGQARHYCRPPGSKRKFRLHGEPWSDEFMRDYAQAMKGIDPRAEDRPSVVSRPKPGTLRAVAAESYKSADFIRLGASTQRVRRLVLDALFQEQVSPSNSTLIGDLPIKGFAARDIRKLRDRKAKDAPETANARLKALRAVSRYAVDYDLVKVNPALSVEFIKTGSTGFHAWTMAEVRKFEEHHPVGTTARLAFALLLLTAQRRSDVVLFGPQHVQDGCLVFTQQKNRARVPIELTIPIVPELARTIAATPTGLRTFIVTSFGRPFTAAGFGNWFRDKCDEAGLPHCSAHGLRKATAARLAELGCPTSMIRAITGHRTSKEVDRYTASADQKALARQAMAILSQDRRGNETVPPSRSEGVKVGQIDS